MGPKTDFPARNGLLCKLLLPLLILLALIIFGHWAKDFWPELESRVAEAGTAGYFLFSGAFIVLTVACVPVSALGFSAGALFGPWVGLAVVYTSGVISGSIMFVLGRSLLRNRTRQYMKSHPRLLVFDRLAGQRALQLNILARLSPLNYGVSCYTLAAGRSGYTPYLVGLLAIFPSVTAQVWFGFLAREAGHMSMGQGRLSSWETAGLIIGLVFFVLLSWQLGKLFKEAWTDPQAVAADASTDVSNNT